MRTIVVAPHPDDEILGAGGTLLRRKAEGGTLAWLIVTSISVDAGWDPLRVASRNEEIRKVGEAIGFDEVYCLGFPTTKLDRVAVGDLVSAVSHIFHSFKPNEVLMPHGGDVHTDHRVVFDAVSSCTKWFRYPSINRVMTYETLSETDFCMGNGSQFCPNVFVDIESYLESKIKVMDIYSSELGDFPFPRSHEAIRALATMRGVASGFKAAEAFELLRERI